MLHTACTRFPWPRSSPSIEEGSRSHRVADWTREDRIGTLNVAGSPESEALGIGAPFRVPDPLPHSEDRGPSDRLLPHIRAGRIGQRQIVMHVNISADDPDRLAV